MLRRNRLERARLDKAASVRRRHPLTLSCLKCGQLIARQAIASSVTSAHRLRNTIWRRGQWGASASKPVDVTVVRSIDPGAFKSSLTRLAPQSRAATSRPPSDIPSLSLKLRTLVLRCTTYCTGALECDNSISCIIWCVGCVGVPFFVFPT